MLSILLSFGFATAASPQITIDELTIDTPTSLIQCETTTLTWTGGNSTWAVYSDTTDDQVRTMYTSTPNSTLMSHLSSMSYSHLKY